MENSFDLHSALAASTRGQIGEWVQAYLRAGTWANLGLADGLLRAPRWWLGPFETPLESLSRKCGPEPEMEYVEPMKDWNRNVGRMAASLVRPEDFPPLIVERRHGKWLIADGNHRHEALLRRGFRSCWVLAWLDSEDEYQSLRGLI